MNSAMVPEDHDEKSGVCRALNTPATKTPPPRREAAFLFDRDT
jgi:hypothetical protein